MLLKSNRNPNHFYVDWWLLNHCNYNCSYCADILKNKSIKLPNIEHCLSMIRLIHDHTKQIKKIPFYTIVGGEITQWPFTVDLLKEIKSLGGMTTIRSNASCGLKEWTELITYTDSINLEYHPEFTGESHFLLQISAALKMQKKCHVVLNMVPEEWNKSENFFDKIQSLYPDLPIHKKILFEDPVDNKEIKNYTDDQITDLKVSDGSLTLKDGETTVSTDYNNLLLESKNIFYGMKCNIGIEQIIIDAWGRVAKGHCRNGGHIGRLGKGIVFATEPTICHKSSCGNAFDIQATKFS